MQTGGRLEAQAEKAKASLKLDACLKAKKIMVLAVRLGLFCSLFRQDIGQVCTHSNLL
jgi:hypothetical protein